MPRSARARRRKLDTLKLARVARARRGEESLRDVEEEVGVAYSTLSRIERAIGRPSFDAVVAIADWAGVDLDSLTRVR